MIKKNYIMRATASINNMHDKYKYINSKKY